MAQITTAVQKQATRLQIDLTKPLSDVDAKRIQTALDDIGVSASLAEIQGARDELARTAQQAVESAGDRSRDLRNASSGSANTVNASSSSVGVRTGAVDVFDAAQALKTAIGKEAAAGGLQWRDAETSGPSLGSPRIRWIPKDDELAQMDKISLKDLFGGSESVFAYWPKNAAQRAPGSEIYLTKDGPFGPQYASVDLRAPVTAPSTPAANPADSTKKTVLDALRAAGIGGNAIVRGRSEVEIFLESGFSKARETLKGLGFVDTRIPDAYTRQEITVQKDPATGVIVSFQKEESGGAAGGAAGGIP